MYGVTHLTQTGAQTLCVFVESIAGRIALLNNIQGCPESSYFVRKKTGAKDVGETGAQNVVTHVCWRSEKSSPSGKGLGQAGSNEMHTAGQTQRGTQASATRPVRPQRVRLIDQNHAVLRFGNIDDFCERTERAGRAVDRIHHHNTFAVFGNHSRQVHRVVMPESKSRCPCRMRTFPKRCMGKCVQIHRCLRIGNGLQQPDVRSVARLTDKAVVLAYPVSQRRLKRARGMLVHVEHARLDYEVLMHPQCIDLRPHNRRIAGHAKVIVAI